MTQAERKRTEKQAASRTTSARHQHDIRTPAAIANRTDTHCRTVPVSPDEQRGETTGDGQMVRGHEASKQGRATGGMDDTTGSLTAGGTAEQVKQDENMRQRIRYEPAIGSISSGIEYEMMRGQEPTPSYHRNPRRFIKLTAHIMPLHVRRAEERNGETESGGGPPTDKGSGTGKQREDEPDGIGWHGVAARNRWMTG